MVTTKEHTLLVEKYRSKVLDEYVGNENIKKTIDQYIKQNDIQNLIFSLPTYSSNTLERYFSTSKVCSLVVTI